MPSPWFEPHLFAFGCLAVGGLALGLLGLLCASGGPRRERTYLVLLTALVPATSLFSAAAVWFEQPAEIWAAPLILVGAFAAVCLASCPSVATWLLDRLRTTGTRYALWGLFLIGLPASAAYWANQVSEPEVMVELDPGAFPFEDFSFADLREVQPSPASTDQGRPVRLLYHASTTFLEPDSMDRAGRSLQTPRLRQHLISVPFSQQNCNCFGWVFAGGMFWLPGNAIPPILEDNGYEAVTSTRAGDLAVYRDSLQSIVHVAVVRYVGADGVVVVESKFGRLTRFLHPHDIHPYSDTICSFYRSPRAGHLLQGLPRESQSVGPDPALVEALSYPSESHRASIPRPVW
jgi:hypothetical protein